MTDKVQKIREEVVRLKSQLIKGACSSQIAMETRCKEEAYDEVLTLFDSLQEEPVSKDLDIAIGKYCSNPDNFITYIDVTFAYRSEQKDDIPLIIKAIKFGAQWQKQQMMKDAMDVDYDNLVAYNIIYHICKVLGKGGKGKLVIIKED